MRIIILLIAIIVSFADIAKAEEIVIHKLSMHIEENTFRTVTIIVENGRRKLVQRDAINKIELSEIIDDNPVSLFTTTDLGDHYFLLATSGTAYVLRGYITKPAKKAIEIYSKEPFSFLGGQNTNNLPNIVYEDPNARKMKMYGYSADKEKYVLCERGRVKQSFCEQNATALTEPTN